MKLFILNGSPRRTGSTALILKELMTMLPPDIDTKLINISGANIQPCVGCLKCRPDNRCILPEDDAHRFGDMIRDADFIIIGTPVYWGNIPGPVKMLFDRNIPSFKFTDGWKSKPRLSGKGAAVILSSVSPFPINRLKSQAAGAARALRTIFKASGMKTHVLAYATDKGSETVAPSMRRNLRSIVSAIKKVARRRTS